MSTPSFCACGRIAVTKDGRDLCLKCLKAAIVRDNPMVGCYRGMGRTDDHKQGRPDDDNPWQSNAIRALEDSPEVMEV